MSTSGRKTLPMGKQSELNELVELLVPLGFKDTSTLTDQLAQHREMYAVLERIRRLESELKLRTTNGRPRTDNVDRFVQWANSNGCYCSKVRIVEHPAYGGLGLESTGPIGAGESVIEVPKALFFYVNDEPRYRQVLDLMPGAMMKEQGNIMLALALIMERFRKDSFWRPYLDVLPERYTTPLFYTPEDMIELRETAALEPALKLCKNIARQYGFIKKFVQSRVDELQHNFTYDVFRWAVSTVMTRQNKLPVNLSTFEELDFTLALIPLWDMANHITPEQRDGHRSSNGSSPLVTDTTYCSKLEKLESILQADCTKAGEPVFINYGKRTDAEFLVHNGFSFGKNPNTRITKLFALNRTDSLYKKRARLLELLGVPTVGKMEFGYGEHDSGELSPHLYALSRVSVLTEDELDYYIDTVDDPLERAELCQRRFEPTAAALPTAEDLRQRQRQWLTSAMETILRRYPTTVAQDEALLHENPPHRLHHLRRLLIEFRLHEKRVLHSFIED
ncbi:actin-histidine N-methyltransferase [Anopheles darlingi]|uniref:actin-histidine N-methyltransferase n=1 Tax=Anopheles darlingi TaxID=43151 RepID=UPI0021002E89|nr:actin-histidine N-methyltransferase [Anopheles darlingi]